MSQHAATERKRAPSKRSLEARARILDAAELVFAEHGFEGASIREIARLAGVQKASVNFHGGSKEDLFERIATRRAEELSAERMEALAELTLTPEWSVGDLVTGFVTPLLDRALGDNPQWLAYARLVAIISADPRWQDLTAKLFDPVAMAYAGKLMERFPGARREDVAAGMVFSVSAMLALCTSQWRIHALSGTGHGGDREETIRVLVRFCEAGLAGILCPSGDDRNS